MKLAAQVTVAFWSYRDGVTFLKVREPVLRAPGQKWGAQPYIYYYPAKIMGGPGPPGPLDDYIPAYHVKMPFHSSLEIHITSFFYS